MGYIKHNLHFPWRVKWVTEMHSKDSGRIPPFFQLLILQTYFNFTKLLPLAVNKILWNAVWISITVLKKVYGISENRSRKNRYSQWCVVRKWEGWTKYQVYSAPVSQSQILVWHSILMTLLITLHYCPYDNSTSLIQTTNLKTTIHNAKLTWNIAD